MIVGRSTMAPMTDDFRCSLSSLTDDEPMVGTAPTDTDFLLVEAPGPWGREAITENRLPDAARAFLGGLDLKVLLIRRHDGGDDPGTRVFRARRDGLGFAVSTTVLDVPEDLLALDLDADLTPYDAPLWLVCTNGRRDLCCAEIGREVTGVLVRRWPEATWETTHLGGHRFSGTLLAFPSGINLGRLSVIDAVGACEEVEAGGVPLTRMRGRAGRSGEDQVREIHALAGGEVDVEVVAVPGPVRRQSCGDLKVKGTVRYEIRPR